MRGLVIEIQFPLTRVLARGGSGRPSFIVRCASSIMFAPTAFLLSNTLSVRASVDLSRFCGAPCARSGRFPFESDRAFPARC